MSTGIIVAGSPAPLQGGGGGVQDGAQGGASLLPGGSAA